MSAQTKKSRKQSAANSRPPPEDVTRYLDRNPGNHIIANALRNAGAKVEIHDDHLLPDAEEWIALVGREGWLAITKDKNIRYRTAELEAIKEQSAMVLVVRAKNATGQEIADTLVKAQKRIQRFVREHDRPFVAGIIRSGRISQYNLQAKDTLERVVWEELRHLVAEMGASQIVYGSDQPFPWPDTMDLVVEANFLNEAEKEAILGGNLHRLLRIEAG